MTRVIRISDSTWESLKLWAVPLDDTPDDVLQRVLNIAEAHRECADQLQPSSLGARSNGGTTTPESLPKGHRTPKKAFRRPILEALYQLGGRGGTREVLAITEGKMEHILGEIDYHPLPSGRIRWRERAKWARNQLKNDGFLKGDSERGTWELTERGVSAVESNKAQGVH